MAVLDTEVVRIEPDFTGFKAKLEAGLKTSTAGVQARVRVVPDFRGFLTKLRTGVKAAAEKTQAKVSVEPNLRGFTGKLRTGLRDATAKTVLKVKVEADCKYLLNQVKACLNKAGMDLAHVAEQREARQAARDAQRERERQQRDAARAAEKLTRDADRAHKARLSQLKDLFGGGGGPGEDLFGGLVDLGRRGVRPINLLIGAAVAAAPAILAVASSAAQASTTLVAFGAAALGATSAVGVLAFAFSGLGDALDEYEQAAEGSEAASQALDARLRAMSPAARALLGELVEIKQEMKGFARLAQAEVLPGFTAFLRLVRQAPRGGASTVAILEAGMLDLGDIIATTMARLGALTSSEFFKGHLAKITGENTAAFQNLSDAALSVLRPITRLVSAAAPQMTRFTQFLEDSADRFDRWLAGFSDADLGKFFKDAGDELARWGTLAKAIIDLLVGIGRAGADAGGTLVDRFGAWIRQMADWVNGPGYDRVRAFFQFFADLPWGKITSGLAAMAGGLAAVRGARMLGLSQGGALEGLLKVGGASATAMAALPGVLKLVAVAAFGVGTAFTYAYTQSEEFRESANRVAAEFTSTVKPAVDDAMAVVGQSFADNKTELVELAGGVGDLAGLLARFEGVQLASWITAISTMFAVATDAVGVLRGEIAKAIADLDDFISLLNRTGGSGVVPIAAEKAGVTFGMFDAAKILNSLGYGGLLTQGLERYEKDIRNWANGVTGDVDRVKETLSTFESQVPTAARVAAGKQATQAATQAAAKAKELAAAQDALSAAQRSSADSAQRWAEALVGANRAIRDAQIGLREANLGVRDAIQDAREAKQAVADARRAIVAGQREEKEAQQGITQARREAAETLKDLRLQVQGLAVDEREARYNLAVAKEVRKGFEYSSSVDPLFRERLNLDVAQAQQTLNETVRDGTKSRQDLADAERKGIERSDQVVEAKKRLADVQQRNVQLQRDLIKAQQDEVRSQEAVRRANEGVTRAAEDLAVATDRRTRASKDAAIAADDEAASVEAARKKYVDLKKEQEKIQPKVTVRTDIIPSVVLTKEYKDLRGKLTLSVYESQVPKEARNALGGPIYGGGDGQSDSVPILASKGEYMQPRAAVNHYGTGVMDAMRRRAVPRGLLAGYAQGGKVGDPVGAAMHPAYRTVLAAAIGTQYGNQLAARQANTLGAGLKVPPIITTFIMPAHAITYAGLDIKGSGKWPLGGPWPATPMHQRGDSGIWQQLLALVKATGIPYEFGNAYRAGDDKWHGSGRAIDFMGYNQDVLGAFFMSIKDKVLELIHTTAKGGYYITRGVVQSSMGEQDALHRNHLHVAMDRGGWLPPGTTVVHNRTGRPERVRTAEQEASLRRIDPRDLKLMAVYIADATRRPIDIDGRRVSESLAGYTYLPPGM